LKSTEKT